MDESIFKEKYQKYKLRVKVWEKDFKKKHGRVPSKYDIREASQDIRDSYKMYYKLKTSFLEETLNDVLCEDGFDVLEMTQSEDLGVALLDQSLSTESINGGPQLPLDITALVQQTSENFSNIKELPTPQALSNLTNRDEHHVIRKFEAVEELAQNKSAWGENVSKHQPIVVETSPTSADAAKPRTPCIKASVSSKLFQSTRSFAKRNPRKPLSRSALNLSATGSNPGASAELAEQLPDLETILIRKAQEHKAAEVIAATDHGKEPIKTHVDEGWLQRNTAQNSLEQQLTSTTAKAEPNNNATPAKKHNYGLSNLDLSKLKASKTASQMPAAENPVEVSQEPPIAPAQAAVRFDSDSDSVVAESEEETEQPEYRHIAKRRRVMPTSESPPAVPDVQPKPAAAEQKPTIAKAESLEENEYGKDFSADEENDATYEPELPKKTKRKQATAKRQKPKAEKKPAAKPKSEKPTPKPKKEKPAAGSKLEKSAKTRKAPARKAATKAMAAQAEEVPEEQPLDPKDLKYVLALESGDITCVPRIKQDELDQADETAQRYISNYASIASSSSSSAAASAGQLNEKRDAARKKLQDKIASGKLNENFVTINIQKKKFARGKKSMNFTKYKKTQWRHKKRVAALTGPDMDMGGCDGGVLTCFNCGGVGHFAQQCKIKGDALLPLTAQLEEDPSPFPTLAEAEQMASQSALAAHSRNIERLPQAANANAIYQFSDSSSSSDEAAEPSERAAEDVNMSIDDEDIDFEALDAAVDAAQSQSTHTSPIKSYVGHKIPEEFLKQAGLDGSSANGAAARSQHGGVKPLYDLNADGSVQELTPEVNEVLHMFGHSSFRKGQDRAVMRILSGMSTLVTLSTGSGKSLCYQLPAYLYSRRQGAITLVISPLVSLMEDQVTGVPHFLRAHCLHTNQTPQQRLKIQQLIADGEIDILLVSPEAVVSGERATGFGAILRQLPPIAFACIDEAHCVSQWSHNFRPSYLMICKVLKKNLGVQTVLGLTATATLPTRISIINHLGIVDGERGIISDIPLPDNLILSVSKDENRDAALLQLLNSPRFESCQSIIIYCTRRDECERIAGFIRTCLQERKSNAVPEQTKKKRKRVNWQAEPYHAGMLASRRRTVQNAFMANELRIVVATIAFGMGINKPDIRAVIHYNMPRNFESYVQEIGRAGRDGLPSHCHLFLDAKGGDQNELRRHVYANSIDRHVIRKLLQRIFVPCCCDKQLGKNSAEIGTAIEPADAADGARAHVCPGHEIGFSVEQTVEALDIPAENISTLLCYMELEPRWCMNVLSSAYIMAKVISYGGPKYLKHAAKECPPLAMAIALQIKHKTFKEDANIIEFSVIDIAAGIGWNSGVVKYQLKNLEWMQVNGYPKRSPISVSFYDLGFRIKAPGDFTEAEIDDALDTLYTRSVKQERTQLIQLQYVAHGLSAVAYSSCAQCCSVDFPQDRCTQLKGIVRNYFRNDYPQDLELEIEPSNVPDAHIIDDVHALINMYPDNTFSGRNIARLFHGISSPNYPAVMWGRCKYWRAHTKVDFNRILKLANMEIVKRRT